MQRRPPSRVESNVATPDSTFISSGTNTVIYCNKLNGCHKLKDANLSNRLGNMKRENDREMDAIIEAALEATNE